MNKRLEEILNPRYIPIAREGWIHIAVFVVAAILLANISPLLGVAGGILLAWCVYFFRDPERMVPEGANLAVAPCDGKVIAVQEVDMPEGQEGEKAIKVSVFMNVFDVHVVRTPVEGKVTHSEYTSGRFFNAALDKASELNENQLYVVEQELKGGKSRQVAFKLIAGLVARRIVPHKVEGDDLERGERVGIIRFGSRVDTYLPLDSKILVTLGQTTISGETVLADLG